MKFDEMFLRKLATNQVVGDSHPFDAGKISLVVKYIKGLVGRLGDNSSIVVKPDFTYYGSGFASYIPTKISKRSGSDTKVESSKGEITRTTKGILLYISNLCPYWYFGGSEWSETTENGRFISSSGGFLFPEDHNKYDASIWATDIEKIKLVIENAGYQLLTRKELEAPLDFELSIRSNLVDGKPRVFDCFFHWDD
jgi:hypothetical protein